MGISIGIIVFETERNCTDNQVILTAKWMVVTEGLCTSVVENICSASMLRPINAYGDTRQ
jgi:hypothetical protein